MKLTKTLFQIFLGINILIGLFFGLLPLINFSMVLELNQIPYSEKLVIFGVVNGVAILFLAAILMLAFYWTKKEKWEGAIIGIIAGFYLFIVGILIWIYTGESTAFMMDSIRGFLTIFLGYRVYKSLLLKQS